MCSSPVGASAQDGGEAAAADVAAALPGVENQVRDVVESFAGAGEGAAGGKVPGAAQMDIQHLWTVSEVLPLGETRSCG